MIRRRANASLLRIGEARPSRPPVPGRSSTIMRRGCRHLLVSIRIGLAVLMLAPWSALAAGVTVGGAFRLTAPDGTTVTDQTYRGKWLLVYFGYTSCPDSCPTALFEIASALAKLGPDAAGLQPLFITIDPERDTRKVMGEYVGSFDRRIVGLTGTQHEIDVVAKAYGVYATRHDSDEANHLFDHSGYIYLMSPKGTFVRGFDHDWSGNQMAAKIHEAMTSSDRK